MNSLNAQGRLIGKNYIEGSNVLKCTVAVKNKMKDKPDNKIPCVAFGKTAELINKYCEVGFPFNITNGIFTSNEYTKEERTFVSYEVVLNEVDFPVREPKNKSVEKETQEMTQKIQENKPQGKLSEAREQVNTQEENPEDFEDDIPF